MVREMWIQTFGSKTGWEKIYYWCIKVESQICSVDQSLVGLQKEVMSISTLRTPIHSDNHDDQQIDVSSTGQIFFSSVPNGVFNIVTSCTSLEEFGRLHCVIDSNKPSASHRERTMRQYAHRTEPLFRVFTPIESLRCVLFVRNIDARGCELHLRDPKSDGNETKYLSHDSSFIQASQAGELEIVKAMVEITQVDLEARDKIGWTPLHRAAHRGHVAMVQCMCEHGVDEEARSAGDSTPLHVAAYKAHFPVVQYLCELGADKEMRDEGGQTPLGLGAHWGALAVVQYLEGLK